MLKLIISGIFADILIGQGVPFMTEKDVRKLNRYQLLELLIVQTERADKLQARLDALEAQMENQELELTSLGSLAEASLQLSGVFEAAQKAADLYLEEARKKADKIVEEAKKAADGIYIRAGIIEGE